MAVCIRCQSEVSQYRPEGEDFSRPVCDECWTVEDVVGLRDARRAGKRAARVASPRGEPPFVPMPSRSPFAQGGAPGLGKRAQAIKYCSALLFRQVIRELVVIQLAGCDTGEEAPNAKRTGGYRSLSKDGYDTGCEDRAATLTTRASYQANAILPTATS